MNKQTRYLFTGNFFIHTRGTTLPVSQRVAARLRDMGYDISIISTSPNKLLRVLAFIVRPLFGNYQLIHIDVFSHSSFFLSMIAATLGRLRGRRVVLNLRGGGLAEYSAQHPKRTAYLFGKANEIVSPSKFLIEYYTQQGYTVAHLPNYVEQDKFPYDRSDVKPYSLLWVRAFHPIYNPEVPIRAFALLKQQFPQATLTMTGPDRGEMAGCKALAESLGVLASIDFTGPVEHGKLFGLFHRHEIFLNTTSYESFGNAVFEAASCGTPIVSSAVGEIPYIWTNGQDIVLCPHIDEQSFSAAIAGLFNHKEQLQQLSANAKKTAAAYSWDHVSALWKKHLTLNPNT